MSKYFQTFHNNARPTAYENINSRVSECLHLGCLEHGLDGVLEGEVEGLGGEVPQHVSQVSCRWNVKVIRLLSYDTVNVRWKLPTFKKQRTF
jgi:hypothetical protein